MIILSILKWVFLHFGLGYKLVEEFFPSIPVWLITLLSAIGCIYGYAHHNGELSCRATQAAAELKQEKKGDKITKNVDNLKPNQYDKRLRPYYLD